jgi:hypothetical protein
MKYNRTVARAGNIFYYLFDVLEWTDIKDSYKTRRQNISAQAML